MKVIKPVLHEVLRQHGIKVTPQRLAVYSTLLQAAGHLSAEEVRRSVQPQLPSISLATVYAILTFLEKKRLVRGIKIDFERTCFEARHEAHHHFMCTSCRRVIDLDMELCPALRQRVVQGHRVEDFEGYLYGICADCQRNKR